MIFSYPGPVLVDRQAFLILPTENRVAKTDDDDREEGEEGQTPTPSSTPIPGNVACYFNVFHMHVFTV